MACIIYFLSIFGVLFVASIIDDPEAEANSKDGSTRGDRITCEIELAETLTRYSEAIANVGLAKEDGLCDECIIVAYARTPSRARVCVWCCFVVLC